MTEKQKEIIKKILYKELSYLEDDDYRYYLGKGIHPHEKEIAQIKEILIIL